MKNTKRRPGGQTMTEYILLIGLIALACIAAVKIFGKSVKGGFENAAEQVQGATGGK
jgi:Flp pilus assembly pilin Flp